MNIRKQTSITLLTLALALGGERQVRAQTFALPFDLTQSSPALTFSIDSNGTFLETGPFNSSATFTVPTGSQMVWFPAFGAFRAGYFGGTQSLSNLGEYSVAFGYDSVASGDGSVALGDYSTASSAGCVALGADSTASTVDAGWSSVALNGGTATGDASFAATDLGTASGMRSTALSGAYLASGYCSLAFGQYALASNYGATAIGDGATATGFDSTALGSGITASGDESVAMGGWSATADSYASFVFGTSNVGLSETGGTPSLTTWVATDPVFEIGNGGQVSPYANSDAFVIYKNGDANLQGTLTVQSTITCAPGGDIPMYTGD